MKKTTLGILVLAAASLAASSCIVAVVDTADYGRYAGGGEFRKLVPFQGGGTVLLESAFGNVEIFGWDRNEAEVVASETGAVRPGFYWWGYPRGEGAQDRVEMDSYDGLLKIRTRNQDSGERSLDYTINLPVSVNVNPLQCREGNVLLSGLYGKAVLDVRQGDVRVENFSGSLDASLGRGRAEVELLDLRQGDEVRITSTSGDIVLSLEKNVSARLEANAPLGQVESEFDLGQKLPDRKIKGQIGDGQAFITLNARQGRISIKKVKD